MVTLICNLYSSIGAIFLPYFSSSVGYPAHTPPIFLLIWFPHRSPSSCAGLKRASVSSTSKPSRVYVCTIVQFKATCTEHSYLYTAHLPVLWSLPVGRHCLCRHYACVECDLCEYVIQVSKHMGVHGRSAHQVQENSSCDCYKYLYSIFVYEKVMNDLIYNIKSDVSFFKECLISQMFNKNKNNETYVKCLHILSLINLFDFFSFNTFFSIIQYGDYSISVLLE